MYNSVQNRLDATEFPRGRTSAVPISPVFFERGHCIEEIVTDLMELSKAT